MKVLVFSLTISVIAVISSSICWAGSERDVSRLYQPKGLTDPEDDSSDQVEEAPSQPVLVKFA